MASRRSAALNYAEIAGFDGRDVIVRDQRSGARLRARPRVVVNAAGAGADRVASLFGVEAHMVDGVAGTHLLLRAPSVARALGEDLLFFEDGNSDPERRRLCAAYAVGDASAARRDGKARRRQRPVEAPRGRGRLSPVRAGLAVSGRRGVRGRHRRAARMASGRSSPPMAAT